LDKPAFGQKLVEVVGSNALRSEIPPVTAIKHVCDEVDKIEQLQAQIGELPSARPPTSAGSN
jgi:hypothetical protein